MDVNCWIVLCVCAVISARVGSSPVGHGGRSLHKRDIWDNEIDSDDISDDLSIILDYTFGNVSDNQEVASSRARVNSLHSPLLTFCKIKDDECSGWTFRIHGASTATIVAKNYKTEVSLETLRNVVTTLGRVECTLPGGDQRKYVKPRVDRAKRSIFNNNCNIPQFIRDALPHVPNNLGNNNNPIGGNAGGQNIGGAGQYAGGAGGQNAGGAGQNAGGADQNNGGGGQNAGGAGAQGGAGGPPPNRGARQPGSRRRARGIRQSNRIFNDKVSIDGRRHQLDDSETV